MSTRDHPDWWKNVGGQNSIDSVLERRSLISNNGVTPVWELGNPLIARGKFFTRGMRGFLENIEVYCANPAGPLGTLAVHISPFPESGTSYQANIIIGAGAAAAWRAAGFNLFWNYDSMFIWIVEAVANVEWAYDVEQPWDGYGGVPAGIIWTTQDRRYWIRVNMAGETPGDVPVSGTLNSVVLPNLTAEMDAATVAVNGLDSGIIVPFVYTMGKLTCLLMTFTQTLGVVPPASMRIEITTDGAVHTFTVQELMDALNSVINTPTPITMSSITPATNIYQVSFNVEIPFRREFGVRVANLAAVGNDISVDALYVIEIIG